MNTDTILEDQTDSILTRIENLKEKYGKRLLIPAHHYQKPEIVNLADIVGDSYRLAVEVSKTNADYIIFCGVSFMAEGAAVLAGANQKILQPEPSAGCPMADMIDQNLAEKAFRTLKNIHSGPIVPIVYMNASAEVKAFCGRNGGAVCTSSNAERILTHYFNKGYAVFFLPDQHLGINTALKMGIPSSSILKVTGSMELKPLGIDNKEINGEISRQAGIFVWDGFCPVHQTFTVNQITDLKNQYEDITIMVHPEVAAPVAQAADLVGSTEQIYHTIRNSAPGTVWGIGTEYNFVLRMAQEFQHEKKLILPLYAQKCKNMDKTTLTSLLDTLEIISHYEIDPEYHASQEISVPQTIKEDAAKALNAMISIVEGG